MVTLYPATRAPLLRPLLSIGGIFQVNIRESLLTILKTLKLVGGNGGPKSKVENETVK